MRDEIASTRLQFLGFLVPGYLSYKVIRPLKLCKTIILPSMTFLIPYVGLMFP
jgi:hypothetical protein